MKTNVFLPIAAVLALSSLSLQVVNRAPMIAEDQKIDGKFEIYRQAIRDAFRVDIIGFKDGLKGGLADGKPVTEYDLDELLWGMNFEADHTGDRLIALEIAMDHLARIPDYYSRLRRMEKEVASDRLLQM